MAEYPTWQGWFEGNFARIWRAADIAFRRWPLWMRDELVQEAMGLACEKAARLWQRGKGDRAHATVLGRYAALQVKRTHAIYHKRFPEQVEFAEDIQAQPVPDPHTVQDVRQWVNTLDAYDRRIALRLAEGADTRTIATEEGVNIATVRYWLKKFRRDWEKVCG